MKKLNVEEIKKELVNEEMSFTDLFGKFLEEHKEYVKDKKIEGNKNANVQD